MIPCISVYDIIESDRSEFFKRLEQNPLKGPEYTNARKLRDRTIHAIRSHGIDKCGFFTITFPPGTTLARAVKIFKKFLRNTLKPLFPDYIYLWDLSSGHPHVHMVVLMDIPIRRMFNISAYQQLVALNSEKRVNGRVVLQGPEYALFRRLNNSLVLDPALRALWKHLRDGAAACGAGRVQLIPVLKSPERVGGYLMGRYMQSVIRRRNRPRGFHLLAYSRSMKTIAPEPEYHSPGKILYQNMQDHVISTISMTKQLMKGAFGSRWGWRMGKVIKQLRIKFGDHYQTWPAIEIRMSAGTYL